MRTRNLLRWVPGLTPLLQRLEARERENHLLLAECQRLAYENYRLKSPRRDRPAPRPDDEPPLPPELLRRWVAGTDDAAWFLASGQRAATMLTALLHRHGIRLEESTHLLDFGCGCGRVLRHWRHTPAQLHGCDANPLAIEWCADHLPFARCTVNALESPLAYDHDSFDVICAFSVFTHLPQPLQQHWLDELHRVLKPGGVLLLSLHGDALLPELSWAERADYRAGRLVVRLPGLAGTNHCAAFHPPACVRAMLTPRFEILDFLPQGATGNPPQDAWLVRKK
ncbi:MAG: class I SAM-dependent methyltransferase [Gemmataceae bacterium]|nr:class I SAM-dependent methyltransferase [Gemmata sp.]MDW8197250.1 class I SAM-dependent methyltransferase [Gemmataceae bacterium]